MAKTESLRRSFYPQAIRLLVLITSTGLNLINCKNIHYLHHPHCCYVYIPGTTCFAHSSCTSLFILIFIKSTVDCIAHFILFHCTFTPYFIFYFIVFYFFLTFSILLLPIFIYILLCYVSFFILFIFALSIERTRPDLHFTTDYILIIPCMIV